MLTNFLMDWNQHDLDLRRLVLAVWILLYSSKYCFGNKTDTFGRTEMTSTFAMKPTSSLPTKASIFHGFLSSTNTSRLNTLVQPLKPSSSTYLKMSSSEVKPKRSNASSGDTTVSFIHTETTRSFVMKPATSLPTKSSSDFNLSSSNVVSKGANAFPGVTSDHTGTTNMFALKPTWSLSTKSSVLHGLPSSNAPTLNTLIQPLRPSSSSSSYLNLSSSDVLSVGGSIMTLSNVSVLNSSIYSQTSSSCRSTLLQMSSSGPVIRGANKTFIAEIRIKKLNFSSGLENKTSSLFHATASIVTAAIDFEMMDEQHYLGCQVISFRAGSVIANLEIKMGPGSDSDPNLALDRLKTVVASGRLGNLTVDSTYFEGWLKKDPEARKRLLYGQLAGVAVILFILVALLLILCLGNFADEPLFQEKDLFSAELTTRHVATGRDNEGSEDDEWKYDPLFAWSHKKTFDSKL